MELLEKQKHAVFFLSDKETTEVVYGGAAGGGKSLLGCLWLISNCQNYKGSRWVMGRSKIKSLKETTLRTFFDISQELGISDQWSYKQQAGMIEWKNGSQIILKDLFQYPADPDFDSLGSLEVTGAFVDEISQVTYKAWSILKSRCRYKLKQFDLAPKLLGSCNPSKGWVFQEFYKPTREGTLPLHRKFIQALPTDNPHLPESYLQSLRELPEASKQRLYYGNWEFNDDDDILFNYEDILGAFDNEFAFDRKAKRYVTADIAAYGSDLFVIIAWQGWTVDKIYTMKQSDGKQIIDKIRDVARRHKVHAKRVIYDADGIGAFVGGFLRAALPFRNGGKVIGKNNYKNLKTQCYYLLSEKLQDGEVYIKGNKKLLDVISEELDAVRVRNNFTDGKLMVSSKDEIRQRIGRSPDYADALMMRMYFDLVSINSGVRAAR